ncbi:MAG: alcohol dehydrogenase catalytic domain-containing protein [Desulfobacterales bacterium]|nr:MAG: alcohol dehydrogenase catalytic domain-containing protein [Desulfobacterales bacterium]
MQAFVKYGKNPLETGLREVPVPEPAVEEVLIAVAGCGICGSDLHAYRASPGYEWVIPPVILGHEFAGTVAAVGAGVNGYQPGDKVVVIAIQGCDHCQFCRSGDTNLCSDRRVIGLNMNGGMAPYAVVNPRYLIRLPENFELSAAAAIETFSVAIHALSKTSIYPEQRIVVTGPGPVGLFSALVARLNGARVLICGTEVDAALRLPAAEQLGLRTTNTDQVPLPRAVTHVFGNQPPDLWIEASGATAALKASMDLVRRGGSIVVLAMYHREFSWFPTIPVRAEQTLLFSYASVYRDYIYAIRLMEAHAADVQRLMQFFPLQRASEAFEEANAGRTLKAILVP